MLPDVAAAWDVYMCALLHCVLEREKKRRDQLVGGYSGAMRVYMVGGRL
jgi:hypothetical protein